MTIFHTHSIVEQIGAMDFQGNTVPTLWYRHPLLRFANGKPNHTAINVLADILYWYRPIEIRDEATGQVERRKKFAADKLQKSYATWAEKFGCSKREITNAVHFLRDRSLITIEFRDVKVQLGVLRNVLFVEPVPQTIARLRELPKAATPSESGSSPASASDVPPPEAPRLCPEGEYTKTTTEITTSSFAAAAAEAPVSNSTRVEPKPGGKADEHTGTHELRLHFVSRWNARYASGKDYYWQGQDARHAKTLLTACGSLQEAKRIVDAYLADDHPFFVRELHRFTLILSHINSFLGRPAADARPADGYRRKRTDINEYIALGIITREKAIEQGLLKEAA